MVRAAGLNAMPVGAARRVLERERAASKDVYLRLSQVGLTAGDPLREGSHRFGLEVNGDAFKGPVELTSTSFRQLSSIAGVPTYFLDRIPASLGLRTFRACLAVAQEEKQDPVFLLRLKDGRTPALRAVLPGSFARFDDRDIFEEVLPLAAAERLKVSNLWVTEDTFAIRLISPERVNFGSSRAPDWVHPGVDVRASETGCHPLEVRRVMYRVVCENGQTMVTRAQAQLRRKNVGVDRTRFRDVLRAGLSEAMEWRNRSAERMATTHAEFVHEPVAEVRRIFREHRLGNPASVAGRLVVEELARQVNLLGVSRFDIIQAFTRVAQGLEHAERLRWEDAMGGYLGSAEEGSAAGAGVEGADRN